MISAAEISDQLFGVAPSEYALYFGALVLSYLLYRVCPLETHTWNLALSELIPDGSGLYQQIFPTSPECPKFQEQFPSSAISSNWARTTLLCVKDGGNGKS
jgi:hypothetical protein